MNIPTASATRLDILLHPERWTLINAATTESRASKAAPAARRAWSRQNAHAGARREILLAVGGSDWFGLNGMLHPCVPGTVFFIDPNVMHDNYYPKIPQGLEHIWLHICGTRVMVAWLLIEGGKLVRRQEHLAVLSQEQIGVWLDAFPLASEPLRTDLDRARMHLLTGLVGAYLAQHWREASLPSTRSQTESMQAEVIDTIRRHIDSTAGREVTLDSLAHLSGYSKFHLLRLFRARIGCTIHQYVDQARARRMQTMQEAGATNSAMAIALGFSSPTAYLRWRRQRPQ